MATFSLSPVPRRSTRLRPAANSPPRRIRVGSTRASVSRLTTPGRGPDRLSSTNDNASNVSGMEVDEEHSTFSERTAPRAAGETVFSRSDELTVSFYAHLPVEVKQELKNADFYGDVYTGDIDTLTGFALVASIQTCFVWQHAQAVKGTPTCYIFTCPRDHDQTSPPLHGLVPYGATREPGLILISLSGEIRFWDSIAIGLAGGDHYSTTSLDLISDEHVTNLVRSDHQTYVASTTAGRLFRLILTSAGGKHHITSHPFARPSQSLSFSRLIPSIFSPPSSASRVGSGSGNISAISLGGKNIVGGCEIWALVDTRIQKWNMKVEGWEERSLDEDVVGVVRTAVRETFGEGVEQDNARMDLELVDIAVDNDDKLVVLVSYAGVEEYSTGSMDLDGIRRMYALVGLSCQADTFKVESVRSVPYQSTSTSGAPMHPRIQLLREGRLIIIQFGNAVVICARDSEYQDRLELKAATDRTFGVGVFENETAVLVLTAATMMKAFISIDKVRNFDSETGRAKLVKSTMTQAILYGSSPNNPLHFSFPPEVDEESLMQGAEQLSQAILQSDPEVVRRNHDLSAQLAGRKDRLSWLIQFINDNAVLVKMSQRSRQKLEMDAEKMYTCQQLWIQHNDLLATSPTHSILNDAVHSYMADIEETHHEDVMRAFFRLHVGNIGKLIRKVEVITKDPPVPGLGLTPSLSEANRIVLTVLKSAFNYRESHLGVYGIDLPMIRSWTSKPAVIDIVLGLFDSTTKVIDSPAPGSRPPQRDHEPHSQLPALAATLFACVRERLDWLGSPAAAVDAGAERDRIELEQRFTLLRPEVLETLRRNGYEEAAFTLAEKYRDFSSLAALCHRDSVYPPHDNPHALRIQTYIENFKDEFTTELYRWYIQHGELRVMFAQEDVYGGYMDRFFTQNPSTSISWMHDLGKGRHGPAAVALLAEAEQATHLETKHLMLSIGKLSHLVQLHNSEASVEESVLDAFHDDLDFVSVHEALIEEFTSALRSVRGRQSLDSQIETIVKAKASTLSDKQALSLVFKEFIRELLQGKALSIEDAIDVLTLKDNTNTVEDYTTALHLLARVQNLPDARRISAFRTVWRRIYIHDDWDEIRRTANITDAELNQRFQQTALYSTLSATLLKENQPEGSESTPDTALLIPTTSEIASRWPGMSPDTVEAIERDYHLEYEKLAALGLNDVYHRVRELAQQGGLW